MEVLAVQLTQREGELIQEKAELKRLATSLKQVMSVLFASVEYFQNWAFVLQKQKFCLYQVMVEDLSIS